MVKEQAVAVRKVVQLHGRESRQTVLDHAANELVFAVVGHVGSGTTEIAKTLAGILEASEAGGGGYEVELLKARQVISEWSTEQGEAVPPDKTTLDAAERFQDLGDMMRLTTGDNSSVAVGLVDRIRRTRAEKQGDDPDKKGPITPDGTRRAYILDSIRHPAEVELLRHIYQDAFILIGVVCEEQVRRKRIMDHYDVGQGPAQEFMKRDAKAGEKHGQRTSDAFHLSDFFVDNTESKWVRRESDEVRGQVDHDDEENEDWDIPDHLSRLVKIITRETTERPSIAETAMHHAYGAKMRSACLSRQVGAALVASDGTLLATGTNEVPRAGGGVYGEGFVADDCDHRCARRANIYCSNNQEQNAIIDEVIDSIPMLKQLDEDGKKEVASEIREGRIGGLLEFSRAVHAEMDALLSAEVVPENRTGG